MLQIDIDSNLYQ